MKQFRFKLTTEIHDLVIIAKLNSDLLILTIYVYIHSKQYKV